MLNWCEARTKRQVEIVWKATATGKAEQTEANLRAWKKAGFLDLSDKQIAALRIYVPN